MDAHRIVNIVYDMWVALYNRCLRYIRSVERKRMGQKRQERDFKMGSTLN